MDIKSQKKDRHFSSSIESKRFTKANNQVADMVLMEGIYENPLESMVRELATNAKDAHLQRGIGDRPFDIYPPKHTSHEDHPSKWSRGDEHQPTLDIRDYGVAMTPDEIEDVYTTFFASGGKSDTNDVHGAFGLGSKSPLAYTNSFIVESHIDGQYHTYLIHRDEEDFAAYAKIDEGASDEEQGVYISVPIDKEDKKRVKDAISSELKFFDPPPRVHGCDDEHISPPDPVYKGEGWWLTRKAIAFRPSLQAVMGEVSYDVDNDRFDTSCWIGDIILFFEIGDLTITSNREGLQYDAMTNEAIEERLDTIRDTIHERAQTLIDTCSTYLEACQIWSDINERKLKFDDYPKYDGFDLSTTIQCEATVLKSKRYGTGWTRLNKQKNLNLIRYQKNDCALVYVDQKYAKYARTEQYFDPRQYDFIYVINEIREDRFLKKMGLDEWPHKTSDFPYDANRSTSDSDKKSDADWLRLETEGCAHSKDKKYWSVPDTEVTNGLKVYVSHYRWEWEPVEQRPDRSPHALRGLIQVLKGWNWTIPPIYGVKGRSWDKKDLRTLHDFFDDSLDWLHNAYIWARAAKLTQGPKKFGHRSALRKVAQNPQKWGIEDKRYRRWEFLRKRNTDDNHLKHLFTEFYNNVTSPPLSFNEDVEKKIDQYSAWMQSFFDDLEEKFPLLQTSPPEDAIDTYIKENR